MSTDIRQELLNRLLETTPIFRGFSIKELATVLQVANAMQMQEKDVVFKEGTFGDSMYVIMDGKVKIYLSHGLTKEETLIMLTPGQCFGEMGIIDDAKRSATARVESQTAVLLNVDEAALSRLPANYVQKLYKNFAAVLAQRLRTANKVVSEASSKKKTDGEHLRQLVKEKLSYEGNLQNADIRNGNFSETFFEKCTFQNGFFLKSDFKGAKFKGSDLKGANLSCATFEGAIFENCNFSDSDLTGAEFKNVKMNRPNLARVKVEKIAQEKVTMRES